MEENNQNQENQVQHNTPQKQDPQAKEPSKKFSLDSLVERAVAEIKDLFSLSLDTDEAGTIDSIRKSIEFKGGNLWGLIFAAFIAAIGLNVNSGAVVIGAMLISPLMGPIVGVGFAIATNDFDMLKNAFQNLAIFVVVSILAATIYFGLSPLKTLTAQLEARTYPTFYDVLIAICGGAIGIVASSRADRGNAIPGVAIATALMPPLCTVGYGIATWNWQYALGAMYLFFINSVFIAGTAFVFVRALNFPHKEFLDPAKEQRYRTIMIAIVVVTIIPSIYTAWNVVRQEVFNSRVAIFADKAKAYKLEKGLMVGTPMPDYRQDTPTIELTIMGGVTENDKANLENEKVEAGLENARIVYRAGSGLDTDLLLKEFTDLRERFSNMNDEYTGVLEDLYKDKKALIKDKDQQIFLLETEIAKYETNQHHLNKPVADVAIEFSALFPQAKEVSYSELVKMNTRKNRLDTLPTVILNWEGRGVGRVQKQRIEKFFKARMKLDTIEVIVY